jgi:hypothetical protein
MLLLVACGSDSASTGGSTASSDSTTTTTAVVTTTPSATTTTSAVTTTAPQVEQLAIWPAADVTFAIPDEAAADFVANVLGVPPVLGEFRQGDSRSGEIEVFSPGEGAGATPVIRSLLLMRQLGAHNGWFVTAAVNDNAAIRSPEAEAGVPAGPLTVNGVGRGFEANIVVSALIAGVADPPVDQQVTMGGSTETPEPFTVVVDLSDVEAGQTVMLLVRGGTGLETDPGDFGAIPITVTG